MVFTYWWIKIELQYNKVLQLNNKFNYDASYAVAFMKKNKVHYKIRKYISSITNFVYYFDWYFTFYSYARLIYTILDGIIHT